MTRLRLTVSRSNKHIAAQIIDDEKQVTLVSASDLGKESKKDNKINTAKEVGIQLAKKAQELKIKQVYFDRNGYRYHGRVQALAEGAREGGLEF